MPPLRIVRLSKLEPVVAGFREMLISDIKIGSSAQWSKLDVVQGKLVQFSLAYQMGIQQIINEVKGHRDSTDELFIDNFGNKSLGKTQHEYFSKLNGDLPRSEDILHGMRNIVSDVKRLSRAFTIFCDINDKNARAPLGNDYNETTIYQAFISICRFNRQELLDDDLLWWCVTVTSLIFSPYSFSLCFRGRLILDLDLWSVIFDQDNEIGAISAI